MSRRFYLTIDITLGSTTKGRSNMKKMVRWISVFSLLMVAFTFSEATTYEIEVSDNDELFVINGEKYEAQTYCFNM